MWINGKRHGYGVFSWSNGNGEYMGQWVNGVQVSFCFKYEKIRMNYFKIRMDMVFICGILFELKNLNMH